MNFPHMTNEQLGMAMLRALEDNDHETAFEYAAELRRRGVITDKMIAQARAQSRIIN